MLELGAGDQRIDAVISLNLDERVAIVGERHHLMTARFEHAGDDQSSRTARIDQSDAH
jgi:hypothetical protein